MNKSLFHKTRIAPTPSGYLHLGNALSMLVTAEFAKRYGCSILLRIDDIDQQRIRKEYIEDIFDTLKFLGIKWEEGPQTYEDYTNNFSQIKRLDIYNSALEQLKNSGRVFACTCSRSDLRDGIYPGTCL